MAIIHKDISTLTEKTNLVGDEKIVINENNYITPKQIIDKAGENVVDAMPVNTILRTTEFDENIFGEKWLKCDGSLVSNTDYPHIKVQTLEKDMSFHPFFDYAIGYRHIVKIKGVYYFCPGEFNQSIFTSTLLYKSTDLETYQEVALNINGTICYISGHLVEYDNGFIFSVSISGKRKIFYSEDFINFEDKTIPGHISDSIIGDGIKNNVYIISDNGGIMYTNDFLNFTKYELNVRGYYIKYILRTDNYIIFETLASVNYLLVYDKDMVRTTFNGKIDVHYFNGVYYYRTRESPNILYYTYDFIKHYEIQANDKIYGMFNINNSLYIDINNNIKRLDSFNKTIIDDTLCVCGTSSSDRKYFNFGDVLIFSSSKYQKMVISEHYFVLPNLINTYIKALK